MLRYGLIGGAVGLAGCTNGDNTETVTDSATDTPSSTAEGTPFSTEEDVQRGGKPVVGLGGEPQAFNPLVTSNADAWSIMERMYPYPTVRNPADVANTHPYVFNDWSFDPDSLTSEVTLTEGFQWSDGEPLDAEGVRGGSST